MQVGDKIFLPDDSIIVANTGQVRMGARFVDVVTVAWRDKSFKFTGKPLDVVRGLAVRAKRDFAGTGAKMNQYGSLVGFSNSSGCHLCEFALSNFQPELKEDIWWVSMGSGQLVVDPILALWRKAFWAKGPPSLNDGVFAVAWTLALAIELCPSGVDGPMKIATLTREKGKSIARFLEDDEMGEHQQNVDEAIKYLSKYPEMLKGVTATTKRSTCTLTCQLRYMATSLQRRREDSQSATEKSAWVTGDWYPASSLKEPRVADLASASNMSTTTA